MIKVARDLDALERDIEADAPNWKARAAKRLGKTHRVLKTPGPIWSQAKPALLRTQHHKCAFCERRLEGVFDSDVEHYRPKGRVSEWEGYKSGSAEGYPWLSHEPANLLAACKACNTGQKLDRFPIRGAPANKPRSTADCAGEDPLLLNPAVDDPATHVGFTGPVPTPTSERGRVTVELLALHTREVLLRERCEALVELHDALLSVVKRPTEARRLRRVERLLRPNRPHSACLRSFVTTFLDDPALAADLREHMELYLDSFWRPLR